MVNAVWDADGCAGNNGRLSSYLADSGFGGDSDFVMCCRCLCILLCPEFEGIGEGFNSYEYEKYKYRYIKR